MAVFSDVAANLQGAQEPSGVRPGPGLNDLLLAASKAMDLMEGKPIRSAMKTAVIAGSIAKLMELPQREATSIVYAALLHDIGLARLLSDLYPHLPPGVSEKQLLSTHQLINARVIGAPHERPLSTDLTQLLNEHPLLAKDFVEQAGLSEDVAELIAAHHELCDGSGYPFGLKAEQIPLGAKILAFANVAEGVLSAPAKEVAGLTTRRHALESFLEIKAAGKFDPDVIEVFRNLIDQNEDFIKQISTLEVEQMVRQLLPERSLPLNGPELLKIVQALGLLADQQLALYKSGRSQNVARLAMQIAEALGIGREQCGELAVAAMLMDVGHLGTPIGLLLRSGTLNAEERELIHDHVIQTQEVIKGIPGFENIQLWSSENHERMNGKGYPGQKKGYEISVGGRILALADVFDALTHHRPYRTHAHEPMDALPVIGQGRQTLYDNQLVTVLRKVVLESELVVR